jgi:mechanosensitive ion channel-like protein
MLLAKVDISRSVQQTVTEFFAFIPELVAGIVILLVGWFVAKALGGLVARALGRAGLDRSLIDGQAGTFVQKVTSSPSRLVGTLVFWAVLLGAVSLAVSVLGINALTALVAAIYSYLPNVLAAMLIFLVAGAISAGVATLATRFMGDTPTGRVVATAAPILVMTIATFMILEQLKIAHDIVVTTYTLLLGAIALASALAFGLGGRDVAARMLEGAYVKGQGQTAQVKRDMQTGRERARQEVDQAQSDESLPGDDLAPRPTETAPAAAPQTT